MPSLKAVSNPNGVNLHKGKSKKVAIVAGFKPQRGKFTRINILFSGTTTYRFKPQRGKFTRKRRNKWFSDEQFQTPTG